MLSRAIDTHAELQRPHDREWIHIILAFLKAYTNETDLKCLVSHDIDEYVARLVAALREAAETLDSGDRHSMDFTVWPLLNHPLQTFLIPTILACLFGLPMTCSVVGTRI